MLVGGVLFIALHAVSDIGNTGLLGAKLASFAARHDQGLAYTLYLTYALDSVGDVFGSLFAFAAGLLVLGFGLGGVIASFGLVLDLLGFVLLLIFVLVSSVSSLRRNERSAAPLLHWRLTPLAASRVATTDQMTRRGAASRDLGQQPAQLPAATASRTG